MERKRTNALEGGRKLKNLTLKTNQQGKKLRFGASPENENAWEMLVANSIWLIGTEQLALPS